MPYQYALSLYRADVVGGESDPNSIAPTHTVQAPGTGNEVISALLYCIDGTSIVVAPWFKDATSGVWLPLIGATATHGTPAIIDVPPGALLAFQLGVNTGSVTKFGVGFVAGDFELPAVGGASSSVTVASGTVTANQGAAGGSRWLVQTQASSAWSIKAVSTALEASRQVSTAAGKLRGVIVRIDATAPSNTYYLQILDAGSLPADGAVTHVDSPIKQVHVNGIDDYLSIDFSERGVSFAAGCFVVLSTTEFTKTISGAYLSVTALAGTATE